MNQWEIWHLDLNKTALEKQKWDPLGRYPGGRGFTSRWLLDNIPPECDPLGPENSLILATGSLGGSGASSSTRMSIGAKSPLTGGIKESNTGGKAGAELIKLGARALIIEGSLQETSTILINKDGFRIEACPQLAGKDIYSTCRELQGMYGEEKAILAIGPAGERGDTAAAIGATDVDGIPARHAARGGLGAVMGSKKIKALVMDAKGKKSPEPADPEKTKAARRRFNQAILNNHTTGDVLPQYGTAVIVNVINNVAGLPTHNFSQGEFKNAEEISGERLFDLIEERDGKPTHACLPGCVIRCSNVVPDAEGKEQNRALEYESITLLGSNCGVGDLDIINRINKRCDEIGLDTIDFGAAVGLAMEAGKAPFGDADAVLDWLDEVEAGTTFGRLLACGAQAVGEALGVERIPTVKRQALAAYDPRVLKGTGVTYATSPMGADHTSGNVLPKSKLPDGTTPEITSSDYQVELSGYYQQLAVILDSMGLCWLTRPPILDDFSLVTDLLEGMYGKAVVVEELFTQAIETLRCEVEFNKRAGVEETNDLPAFFRLEPLPPLGYVFDVDQGEMDGLEWLKGKP